MTRLTKEQAKRLLVALARLEAHEQGVTTILLKDIVAKLERV